MPHIERLNPPDVAAPRATYSHAVIGQGRVLWLSGQVAIDEDGATVGVGDAGAQTEQVARNIERTLVAAGAGWSDVVRFTFYVVEAANVAAVRDARTRLWTERYPAGDYPTSTLVVVAGLASEDFLVEIEATAVLPA